MIDSHKYKRYNDKNFDSDSECSEVSCSDILDEDERLECDELFCVSNVHSSCFDSSTDVSKKIGTSDENDLVEAARNGDSLAITMLVVKYHGFLDKYVGLLNIPVRYKDDYIQEGLIGLLKAVRTFDSERGFSFSTYAWRCIKNSIISEMRRNERNGSKNEISMDEIPGGVLEEFLGVVATSPEDEYIDKESSAQLHDTIFSVLSTYESQVFGMYLAEIPYSLIASRLGKDVKSIDNAIQRIKNKLKKLV